jgi:hypothetical protein
VLLSPGSSSQETEAEAFSEQASEEMALHLEFQKPIDRELQVGEAHRYEIKTKEGQHLNIVAEPNEIYMVLTLADSNGKILVEADSPNSAWGPEPASLIAVSTGN